MSSDADQPILILGMHRSGTSYLAQVMQSLGVFIGDDLVGPQKGNLRGHYEARPLLEFHQQLIAARDRTTRRAFDDGMLVQAPLDLDLTDDERQQAEELIAAMRRPGPWGWKEPRTCLFLDMWLELLPQAKTLVVYRHPLEVHQSLLRRDHWDLALFPDQALRAYAVYNRILLEKAGDGFIFNANSGFQHLSTLADGLRQHFGLGEGTGLPEFHAAEFQTLRISKALHRLFGYLFPDEAAIFDQLQAKAAIPYEWEERDDDEALNQAADSLQLLVEGLPPAGRASFVPFLDWWASGKDGHILSDYEELAREIGEHIRMVKQWNDEAAVIFEENKRLAADYERMGKDYAKQQEFLAKQAATQAKVWGELKWTGDSWKEQKAFIEKLQKEIKALREEVQRLRDSDQQVEAPEE
ncbi:MAG TPA: sulfotransferase [Oceanipulchritudo sp.]|nr:sulfotransferase [Oceanipulchritudo sp.]